MTTLLVARRAAGATDAHGNPVTAYGTGTPWEVWALAPGAQDEPGDTNRDLSLVEWTVYAPNNADAPTEYDRVIVDGDMFEVVGRPQDWTRGPWSHPTAGLVVELRRAEG